MTEKERYQKYLCSPEWWSRRNAVMDRANGVCERCNIRDADHVHHLTYARKYREDLEDLQAVCSQCHDGIHNPPKILHAFERCKTGYYSMAPFEIATLELMIMAPQVVFIAAERLRESMESVEAKRLFEALVGGGLPDDEVANETKRWAEEKCGSKFNRTSAEERLAVLLKRVEEKKDEESWNGLMSRLNELDSECDEALEILGQIIGDARQRNNLVN